MLSVTRHTSFAALAREWEQLQAAAPACGPFLTWQWHSLWWEVFREEGDELYLLAVRADGAALGIAPLLLRQRRLSFACGSDVSDYLDVLARPEQAEAVAGAVARFLDGLDWSSLSLDCLAAEAVALRYLAPSLEAAGLPVAREQQDTCPTAYLPDDWQAYLSSLSKKDRHELRRKIRRLEAADGARSYTLVGGEIGERDVDDFLALLRLSAPDKAAFMDERMARFFQGLFVGFAAGGLLRLYFLEVGGRRVASALCFDCGDELQLYNCGYDPTYAGLSVGLILKAYSLRDAIALGRQRFNFLRGDERYKYDLGGVDAPLYGLRVVRRS